MSDNSVSSRVAFFISQQQKEAKNAVSAKVAFFQEKAANSARTPKKSRTNGKFCGNSAIKEKLTMFQNMERKAKKEVEEQEAVKQFFRERSTVSKLSKPQIKQNGIKPLSENQLSVGTIVPTTFGNGIVANNVQNEIVPVKLKWATAYIHQDILKIKSTAKRQMKQECIKRGRESSDNMPNPKKTKTNGTTVAKQLFGAVQQNGIEHPPEDSSLAVVPSNNVNPLSIESSPMDTDQKIKPSTDEIKMQ